MRKINRIKLLYWTALIMVFVTSCEKNQIIHISSLDKDQSITVINNGDFRYVIDGKHNRLPDSNFIKLSVQGIDPLGDGLHVCWRNENYEWQVVVHGSTVIYSTLDSLRFNFKTSLPLKNGIIPTELKFRQKNCAIFDFHRMMLSPDEGAIVEYN
jgi:hypothetical protein